MNVRLDSELKQALEAVAKRYRTTTTALIEAYAEYLRDGGRPIGYPNEEGEQR